MKRKVLAALLVVVMLIPLFQITIVQAAPKKKEWKGKECEELQEHMALLGFFAGEAEPSYGEKTKEAVLKMQSALHLATDGELTEEQWKLLRETVKDVEHYLKEKVKPHGPGPGVHKKELQKAIKQWQKDNGYAEDGILTLEMLKTMLADTEIKGKKKALEEWVSRVEGTYKEKEKPAPGPKKEAPEAPKPVKPAEKEQEVKPVVTEAPKTTATPKPTTTPTATTTPKPTAVPTVTSKPTVTIAPTATPKPTATAVPTVTPKPTATVAPTAKPTATPKPTAAPTQKPSATEQWTVQEKLDYLLDKLGATEHGAYFTVNRKACSSVRKSGHGCTNCNVADIVQTSWFKNLFGEVDVDNFPAHDVNSSRRADNGKSCFGFACFAQWYLFADSADENVVGQRIARITFNASNIKKYAVPGDVIRVNGHSVVVYSIEDDGIWVVDSNWNTGGQLNCIVQKWFLKYTNSYVSGYTAYINRPTKAKELGAGMAGTFDVK